MYVYLVSLLLTAFCDALAKDVQNDRSLTPESYDFTSEREIPLDVRVYISRIMSGIAKSHADEIKGLRADIESQGKQIKVLEHDKLTLTSVVQTLERRIEHLERKAVKAENEADLNGINSVSPIADDTFIEEKFQDPAIHRSTSLSTPKRSIGNQNRIKRAGVGKEVAFLARIQTQTQHVVQNQIVIFSDVVTNFGSAYNGSNGIFVAPFAGIYVFSITIGHQNGDDTFAILVVNGTPMVKVIVSEEQSTQTVVINLKAGDVVALQNAEIERDYTGEGYSSFSGFLLYEDVSVNHVVG